MLHKDATAANAHLIGYVQDADPGAVGAGKVWVDSTAGTGAWIFYVRNAADDGWESPEAQTAAAHTHTESEITDLDKYTQTEVDNLIAAIDLGTEAGSAIIPHFSKGTGPFTVHCVGGFVYCGDAGAAEVARVHPRDFILVMNGGAAVPTYTYDIKLGAGAYAGQNANPTVPYVEVDADDGTALVTVYVSDGTTVRETEVYIVCQGTPTP